MAFLQRRQSLQVLLTVSLIYSFILSVAYLSFVIKFHSGRQASWQSGWPPVDRQLEAEKTREVLGIVKGRANEVQQAPKAQRYTQSKTHWGYRSLLEGQLLRMQCTKCAVVSSSGHLINSRAGREIDATPCVFRMNNAPVMGYEVDVGSRTTVRSLGHVNLEKSFDNDEGACLEMLVDNRTRANVFLINWMSKTKLKKLSSKEYRFAVLLAHLFQDVKFYTFTWEKMKSSEVMFKNYTGLSRKDAHTWLSTGWYTLVAAMDICKEIVVYGMAYEDYCSSSMEEARSIPYHYYEADKLKECSYYNQSETKLTGGHLFITEKAVFARWAAKRRIAFKHPAWPPRVFISPAATLDTPFLKHYRENKRQQRQHRQRRRVQLGTGNGRNAVQLRMGNQTITVSKEHLLDKLVELLPGAKVLDGLGNDTDTGTRVTGSGDGST